MLKFFKFFVIKTTELFKYWETFRMKLENPWTVPSPRQNVNNQPVLLLGQRANKPFCLYFNLIIKIFRLNLFIGKGMKTSACFPGVEEIFHHRYLRGGSGKFIIFEEWNHAIKLSNIFPHKEKTTKTTSCHNVPNLCWCAGKMFFHSSCTRL